MSAYPFWLQRRIWSYLQQGKWQQAGEVFDSLSLKTLSEETNLWNFLYGVWLYASEGRDSIQVSHTRLKAYQCC